MIYPDIAGRIVQAKANKIAPRPTNSNRASMMGRECIRQIVYNRTRWQEAKMHDVGLQLIFDAGRVHEDYAAECMREAGFRVLQQQRPLGIPELEITGSIDYAIDVEGVLCPVDAKGMAPSIWQSLEKAEDFFTSKYEHVRGYPAQLLLYADMMKAPAAGLLAVNKVTYAPKSFWFEVDQYRDFIEGVKEKASIVTKHVRSGTLPDRTEDIDLCDRCAFRAICLPDKDFGEGETFVDDADLKADIDRHQAIKATAAEFKELDEDIKSRTKALASRTVRVGPWQLTVSDRTRREWVIDEDIKKMIGEPTKTPYKVVTIKKAEDERGK
jgi:hypothetical protein